MIYIGNFKKFLKKIFNCNMEIAWTNIVLTAMKQGGEELNALSLSFFFRSIKRLIASIFLEAWNTSSLLHNDVFL